jgi:uncharacterized membrane protein
MTAIEGWRMAKRPRVPVAGPYGRPLHPALVTVPIGTWLGSVVFDVASRTKGPAEALATGSTWLTAVGLAGAVPAAGLGFLDLLQVPAGTRTMRLGVTHMWLNLTAVTLELGALVIRVHRSSDGRGVPAGLIGLSGAAFALLAVSGHLGGRLAYQYGVRVADESVQRQGYGSAGDQR